METKWYSWEKWGQSKKRNVLRKIRKKKVKLETKKKKYKKSKIKQSRRRRNSKSDCYKIYIYGRKRIK